MTHDEIKEDLPLFVLGGLTPAEAAEIERHLTEDCADCQAEIEQWREVMAAIPLAAGEEERPPEALRGELLRRLHDPAAMVAEPRRAEVIPLRPSRLPLVALAAAAVLALVWGLSRDTVWRSQLTSEQQVVAQLRSALNQATTNAAQSEAELKKVRDQLAARDSDLASLRASVAAAQESLALIRGPGLSLVRLKQTADAKPAEGHVLISPSGKALFYAFDLGPLPAGKVYELWWITEKEGPVNAGLFRPDANGLGQVDTTTPTAAGAIKAAAVTIEPEGGVSKPTGPMVLIGNI